MFFQKKSIKKKYIIFISIYYTIVISLFAYFFLCIGKVPPSHYMSNNFPSTVSVGNFNNETLIPDYEADPYTNDLNTFLNNTFKTRNDGFLTGNVSDLYNFYTLSNSDGKYSLDYEFRRISYLRDWALERSIIFTSISSLIIINDISKKNNTVIVNLDEHCTFTYMHNKGKALNKFSLTIPHILTIYTFNDGINNHFSIDKDYYCDLFNDELDTYTFTLTENILPYTKRMNLNYKIDNSFKEDDVIKFEKSLFIDHKAIISGYDSNGYPLIDSNTLNISSMPFDLGWKKKNIKPSY